MKPLVIFGVGQIAEVANYLFSEDSAYDVSAFAVDENYRDRDTHLGLPVIAFEQLQESHPPDEYDLFVAMGYSKVNVIRRSKVKEARAKGYNLASYVSSRAWVWHGFEARGNTMVMEHNTIQPYVTVGENCILWSGNHIGHHTKIGDNVFVASHAVIAGSVSIGDGCFIGINATIKDNITIGPHCVVGAGAMVLQDAPGRTVFPGTPTEPSRVPSDRLRSI